MLGFCSNFFLNGLLCAEKFVTRVLLISITKVTEIDRLGRATSRLLLDLVVKEKSPAAKSGLHEG